jgi:O-acetyl-ADP-ribose deacetylase (regulator of RNase III)
MKIRVNNTEVELIQGDITESDTEAIVNAANSQLLLGGGVAGAIRTKGGPAIQEECDAIGHCPTGDAAVTSGGNLPARYVIHAVGPRWGEGEEVQKLRDATWNSLKRADEVGARSITFPAISTGIFGFPLELAAKTMLQSVRDYLSGSTEIQKVVFALFDGKSLQVFEENAVLLQSD